MSRALRIIKSPFDRAQLAHWMGRAPWGTRVELKAPKRSLPQNDKLWASLTDVAQQQLYHGLRLSPEDWKLLFLDALKREVRMVPNLDGNGFVSLGRSSSDLSKAEMSDLLEVIMAWGAEHGVIFQESREMAA